MNDEHCDVLVTASDGVDMSSQWYEATAVGHTMVATLKAQRITVAALLSYSSCVVPQAGRVYTVTGAAVEAPQAPHTGTSQ